jgi:hypothetical protein
MSLLKQRSNSDEHVLALLSVSMKLTFISHLLHRIYKYSTQEAASERTSCVLNGCAAQLSGQMPTLEVKTGSCSLSVENLNSSQKEKRKGSRAAALKSSDAK